MADLRFKAYCVEHNIRQAEISEILKITKSNANLKLNGRKEFTLSQIKTLCHYYKISADEYFI